MTGTIATRFGYLNVRARTVQAPQQTQPKRGRNDPCWCGSGKKYKKCHLNRSVEEPTQSWEAADALRRAFSAKFCLAPEHWHTKCTGNIVRAHTIPKANSLARIARDGHVYSFVPSLQNLIRNEGALMPELLRINHASTFTGFCSKHDDLIFAPVEKVAFTGTPEQCFLLGYRAFAREIFTKRVAASQVGMLRKADRGKSVFEQIRIQRHASELAEGLNAALSDNEHRKRLFDGVLDSRDFGSIQAYVIEFDSPPPVMCSGSFCPEQDFEGNQLQDLSDLSRIPHLISVNSFYGERLGVVVFSWLSDDQPTCQRFIGTLARISDAGVTDAILRLLFEFCENVHMQPGWWEALTSGQQITLVHRMTVSANSRLGRANGCLTDDGLRFMPWPVRKRYSIGPVP